MLDCSCSKKASLTFAVQFSFAECYSCSIYVVLDIGCKFPRLSLNQYCAVNDPVEARTNSPVRIKIELNCARLLYIDALALTQYHCLLSLLLDCILILGALVLD